MADAVQVRDHGHTAFQLDPGDQTFAATRDDDVDPSVGAQHRAHGGAIGRRHQLQRIARQAGCRQPIREAPAQHGGGLEAFRSAPQNGRVSSLHANRPGIDRHIRPTFINDADDAQGNTHSLEPETVGLLPLRQDRADRVGLRRNGIDPSGDRRDPIRVERQAIEHRG